MSTAQICEMRDYTDTEGQSYAMYSDTETGADIEACKPVCFQDSKCKAVASVSGKCHMFSTSKGSDSNGKTLSKKICYPGQFTLT